MKKSKLLILACASLLLNPATLNPVQAAEEPVNQSEKNELTTDQFIEKYCGSWIETVHPDQTRTRVFTWFTAVDEKTAPIVTKGRLIFDTYTKEKQDIILKAAQAVRVDYLKYSDACKKLVEEKKLTLPADEPEKPAQENAAVPTPAPVTTPVANPTTASDPAQTQTSPDKSAQPAAPTVTPATPSETSPTPDPVNPDQQTPVVTPEENGQPTTSPNPNETSQATDATPVVMVGDLQELSEDEQPDETLNAIAQIIAQNKGLENAELQAVHFTMEENGQSASTGRIWKMTAGDQTVYFELVSIEGQKARISFVSPAGYHYDLTAGTLTLNSEGEMEIDLPESTDKPEENEDSKPAEEPGKEEEAGEGEAGSEDSTTSESTQPEEEKENGSENTQTDPSQPSILEKAPVAQNPAATAPATDLQATTVTNTTQAKTDPQCDAFINRYCFFNGSLIARANRSNYQQLISGIRVWNDLSALQRGWINTYLLNHTGVNYQTLYRQASQIRLGLPVTSISQRPVVAGSVPTAATEDLSFWIASFGFSAIALGRILKSRSKSE